VNPRLETNWSESRYRAFYEWAVARFDQWDPLDLLCGGENPGREYEPEVTRIVPLIPTACSSAELATKMRGVFVSLFDEEMVARSEGYEDVAAELMLKWRQLLGSEVADATTHPDR
jgi:hypothetical protein